MSSLPDCCLLDTLQHVEDDCSFAGIDVIDEEVDGDTDHQRCYACFLRKGDYSFHPEVMCARRVSGIP